MVLQYVLVRFEKLHFLVWHAYLLAVAATAPLLASKQCHATVTFQDQRILSLEPFGARTWQACL